MADRERLHGWSIFCVNDETIEFLAKNRAALSRSYLPAVPPWEITRNFYEKDKAYALAASCNLAIPRQYDADSLERLLSQDLEFPVVLKPAFKKNYYEKTRNKAIRIDDREQLAVEYKAMNRLIPAAQIVVQELIPGGTRNLFSYAALFDGHEMVAGLSAARLRQHPMDFGHATTYAEMRDIPQLKELATRFLRALGYRGVAEVEFMWDERSQTYKFIEMNGRFWGWHVLTQAAGLNFPADLFRILNGKKAKWTTTAEEARWMRAITDVPTVMREVCKGKLSLKDDYWPTLQARKAFAVWSWSDPLPAVAELMLAPYLFLKKGF